jgi:hypothetical protein
MNEAYDELRKDLEMLARLLLPEHPRDIQPDGDPLASDPSEEDGLRIRAYLILAHSGIEEIIENQVLAAVREAVGNHDSTPPAVALALVAKYADDIIGQNAGKVPAPRAISQKLPGLYESKVIRPNNGIRRKSIVTMCRPLGIELDELSSDMDEPLRALDTLGAKRGAAAHSLRGAAQQVIHAHEAREWVADALTALDQLLPVLIGMIARRELLHQDDDDE